MEFTVQERQMLLSLVKREKEALLAELKHLEVKLSESLREPSNGNGTHAPVRTLDPSDAAMVLLSRMEKPVANRELVLALDGSGIKIRTMKKGTPPSRSLTGALQRLRQKKFVACKGERKGSRWSLTPEGKEQAHAIAS